jgi:NADH:ubiquinone oxidoreductase subunit 6 (subunit J)
MSALEIAGLCLLAVAILGGALGTVLAKNLVHSVLWLAFVLVATAGVYVRLSAGFLAGAQVLLYAGGVVTLAIIGVMLSARLDGAPIPNESRGEARGALTAVAVFALLAAAILSSELPPAAEPEPVRAAALGVAFLKEHLLAFEVLSVLLVAAMIGAIAIARKEDA